MAFTCFSGVARLLDTTDKVLSPLMLEDGAESSEGSACVLLRSGTQNDMTDMSTVDTLPELGCSATVDTLPELVCSEQDLMKDCSLSAEEWLKLFQDDSPVQPWAPERFEMVKKLQEAPRNKGAVDLMRDIASGGCFVAVKRMPLHWTCSGPTDFKQQHCNAMENPWLDAGLTAFLHSIGFAYVCDPVGVFRDSSHTYMVGTYATKGDLFSWIEGKKSGTAQEAMVRPLAQQIFDAVKCLHENCIAHRDISLENILLTHEGGQERGALQVKLIDFGAASLTRMCSGMCGKPSYAAPEVYESGEYDGFLSDAFSVGVVLFTLTACGYPWMSTRAGKCKMFTYVCNNGLRAYLRARRIGGCNGTTLAESLSEPLVALLEGLVVINPADRFTLGKGTRDSSALDVITGSTTSVWDSAWLKDSA